jgi:hypothetical protein
MKSFYQFTIILAVVALAGCASPQRVSRLEGSGTKKVYTAPVDVVWSAALDAAQDNGLRIANADRALGYIDARRSVRIHTLGENVGIWVTPAGPGQTTVEVVSRQAGPPVASWRNWENEIQRSIAANLDRAAAAHRPPGSYERERVRARIAVPETPTARLREERLIYNDLVGRRDTAEAELALETDRFRRAELQREVDRLQDEIRLQENRVQQAERDVAR